MTTKNPPWWTWTGKQEKAIVELAMSLPCSEIHPVGAPCSWCGGPQPGGYDDRPAYLVERLMKAADHLGVP